MWTIKQLKERGRSCFQRNYWKAVLVAVIISMIGGMPGSRAVRSVTTIPVQFLISFGNDSHAQSFDDDTFDFNFDDGSDSDFDYEFDFGGDPFSNPYGGYGNNDQNIISDFSSRLNGYAIGVIIAIAILAFFILTIVFVIRILVDIFFFNPLFVGTQRFFIHNLSEEGMVGDMGFGFDRNYKNQVRVMFARDLYTFAWSLLFLIPGIYKSYEYRMVPYLMAEYPNMSKDQVFYTSKYLMKGDKWHTFIMDLSFIGWWILSGITFGIVGAFYVNPYYISTCSALYEALKMIKGIPAMNNEYTPSAGDFSGQINDHSTTVNEQPDFTRPSEADQTAVDGTVVSDQPVEGPGFVMHDSETRGDSNEEN